MESNKCTDQNQNKVFGNDLVNKIHKEKKTLKEEALYIVEKLEIIKFLDFYGRVEVVGSVAFDLILNRDIDVHLLTTYDIYQICDKLIVFLNNNSKICNTEVEDYKDKQSICLIIKDYNKWNIEVWISNNQNYVGFKLKKDLEKLLNDEKRKIIMEIKKYYNDMNLLHGEMSTNIYKAVAYYNINSIGEFKKYISNKI